jgi:hypothetical protein
LDPEVARKILEALDAEIAEQWLIFLDDEQISVKRKIEAEIQDSPGFQFHLILGGAGTGKTQVLLNLAESLEIAGVESKFVASDGVKSMILRAGFVVPQSSAKNVVHLIDDPLSFDAMRDSFRSARLAEARAVVVAIDPFQWVERLSVIDLATLTGDFDPTTNMMTESTRFNTIREAFENIPPDIHILKKAYRQSAKIGRRVSTLTASTHLFMNPFRIRRKADQYEEVIRPMINALFSETKWPRRGGVYKEIYPWGNTSWEGSDWELWDASSEAAKRYYASQANAKKRMPKRVWKEIARIASSENRWKWTESVLVVVDPDFPLDETFEWEYSGIPIPGVSDAPSFNPKSSPTEVLNSLNARIVEFSDHQAVRGQEFQDVLILISSDLWFRDQNLLESPVGAGSQTWETVTPLHTFMTRCVDNLTVVVG